MRRLFSGSLPFKKSQPDSSHTLPPPTQRSSLKSRRNPSVDAANLTISPPIPESFHKAENAFSHPPAAQDGPMTPPRRTPGSPNSPRNLRRKPVPGTSGEDVEMILDQNQLNGADGGMSGSVSFGSVASFVLEEAPKRRTRGQQGEYR
jgi:hypothetical protein